MGSSTALADPASSLVIDTSAIINLIASGSAPAIISALLNRLVVVDVVVGELEEGRRRGRDTYDRFSELTTDGRIVLAELDEQADKHFEDLVIGAAASTLDDGEAATIAYALTHSAAALIDERKATRLCGERYPHLNVYSTLDILRHPAVERDLPNDVLSRAVFNALSQGLMSVPPPHLEWVVALIGAERASICPSLPRRVRSGT